MPSGETRMARKGGIPMATAYINGKIYTMKAEGDLCSAFVVEDGKFLYCGTDEVTQGDLVEPQIIPDEAFRLLINALLIARFGLDALKITARRGQREYTLRRLIRREARGNTPSAGLLFPSGGR